MTPAVIAFINASTALWIQVIVILVVFAGALLVRPRDRGAND